MSAPAVISADPRIIRGATALVATQPVVAVLGNFDGVHLGHQALLATARKTAARLGGVVVAYTFDPHPASVLAPTRAPTALTSIEAKTALLLRLGADLVVIETFSAAFAAHTGEAFFHEVLRAQLGAVAVVVGYDFTYGAQRSGNASTLQHLGEAHAVEVTIVPAVADQVAPISSTRIREHLRRGELALATACLGHHYTISGVVEHGKQRGRTLGFPTANLALSGPRLLPSGVYAVTLRREGDEGPRPAVASLGMNPTFDDVAQPLLEVHVLDWAGNLYGQRVDVEFWGYLRPEAQFAGIDALAAQIAADVAQARLVFGASANAAEFIAL